MLFCVAGLLDFPTSFAQQTSSAELTQLRVGIISYDNPKDKISFYQRLFSHLSADLANLQISDKPSFAVGTYADVLDWISRGLVDLAILSPSAFAEMRQFQPQQRNPKFPTGLQPTANTLDCVYIATQGLSPADEDSWGNDKLKRSYLGNRCRYEYNSICIVRANSTLSEFAQLQNAAERKKVEFVFGDPLSASGTILPMHILCSHGIDFRDHMEYSFGQGDSIAHLENASNTSEPEIEHVAFVSDGALKRDKRAKFRYIKIPLTGEDSKPENSSLNDILLPQEVLVARKDFDPEKIADIRHLLVDRKLSTEDNTLVDFADLHTSFKPDYTKLHEWAKEVREYVTQDATGADLSGMSFPIRFKDVISLVRHYNFIHNQPDDGKKARLALVLAGGGAKCAYEAGVVTQLESELRPHNVLELGGAPVDIDLVVGTSGGALNAVPIAAGISQHGGSDSPINNTWKALNALDILSPPPHLQLLLGLTYAFCYFVAVRLIVFGLQQLWWKSPVRASQRVLVIVIMIAASTFLVWFSFFYLRANWLFWLLLGSITFGLLELQRQSTRTQAATSSGIVVVWLILLPLVFLLLSLFFPKLLLYIASKWLFYIMLCLSFGVITAAIVSAVWGLFVILLNKAGVPAVHPTSPSRPKAISAITNPRWLHRMLSWADPRLPLPASEFIFLITVLLVIALLLVGHRPGGLFRGEKLTNAVTKSYADLFGLSPNFRNNDPKSISKNIYKRIKDGQRDLVITASSITERSRGTRYFYVQAEPRRNTWGPPSYGTQGIEIGHSETEKPKDKGVRYEGHCDPENLMDVAIGSGTIFPFFPAHKVKSRRNKEYSMKRMDLIDGGFAHNSPIQAAVRWGATHIILLQVSPEQVRGGVKATFWENAKTAFNYLYDQAQFADVDAQEEAAVFMLQPEPQKNGPSVGLLDFGRRFAEHQLKLGSDDAKGWRFVRQPAAPHFWTIPPITVDALDSTLRMQQDNSDRVQPKAIFP